MESLLVKKNFNFTEINALKAIITTAKATQSIGPVQDFTVAAATAEAISAKALAIIRLTLADRH